MQCWGLLTLFSPLPRPPPSPAQRLTGDPVGMLSGWGLPTPSSLSIETCCMSSYFLPCSCPLPWPRRVWRWVWVGGREDCGSGGRGLSSCCLAFPQLPNPICMLFTPYPDPLADGTPPCGGASPPRTRPADCEEVWCQPDTLSAQ